MLGANAAIVAAHSPTRPPAGPPPSREYVQRTRQHELEGAAARAAADEDTELVPAYQVWPAKNTFCCWGFCMQGPEEDSGPNTCAWLTVLSPMALFFYIWGDTLAQTSLLLLYVTYACFASTIVWFLATTFTDPGILPRNPDPLAAHQPPPPLYRHRADDDGNMVTDTWCSTCLIYRPPRASHCPDCDNCVRDFDHHCPFTRNCIGARNYPYFLNFLISVSLSLAVLLFSCMLLSGGFDERAVAASRLHHTLDAEATASMLNATLLLFAVVLSLVMWGFTGYHISLVCSGLTTKEHLKGRKHGAKQMHCCERLECWHAFPSQLEPRRLVPAGARRVPVISHTQL